MGNDPDVEPLAVAAVVCLLPEGLVDVGNVGVGENDPRFDDVIESCIEFIPNLLRGFEFRVDCRRARPLGVDFVGGASRTLAPQEAV